MICAGGGVLPNRCENPKDVGVTLRVLALDTAKVTGTVICPAVADCMAKEPV